MTTYYYQEYKPTKKGWISLFDEYEATWVKVSLVGSRMDNSYDSDVNEYLVKMPDGTTKSVFGCDLYRIL